MFHSFYVKTIYRTFALNAYQAQYLFVKKEAPAKQSSFLNPESPVPLMYVWLNNRDGVEYMTW